MRELTSNPFPPLWRRGVYEAIYRCRDVRRFLSRPVSDKVLRRILRAAHQAGSVGAIQPWTFIVIHDLTIKHRVKQEALLRNDHTLTSEAIVQAPINLAVTSDGRCPRSPERQGLIDPDLLLTSCAIQNLWLAARAEGVGMGWVNNLDPSAMKNILELPEGVVLVAYLAIGYVARFPDTPLATAAESRLSLESVLFYDRWGNQPP